MIQNVLRHLGGIENYGIVSLCLFFLIFSAMVAYALLQRKPHLDHMSRLPLENETQSTERLSHER